MAGRPRKVQATEPVDTTPELSLTPEEIKAILAIRERGFPSNDEVEEVVTAKSDGVDAQTAQIKLLEDALTQALKSAQPEQKKTIFNRVKRNPWTPTDGSPKILQFKRKMYHHGIEINPKRVTNENCLLLDKIKPGIYCSGYVRVTKRKDGGLDIDYPIRTSSQRLKIHQFGIEANADQVAPSQRAM